MSYRRKWENSINIANQCVISYIDEIITNYTMEFDTWIGTKYVLLLLHLYLL